MQEALEGFRLAPQQKRLWALQQADRGEAYGAWLTLRLEGDLDPDLLAEAVRDTLRRHEILRTRFLCPEAATIPLQVLHDEADLRWESSPDAALDESWGLKALRRPVDLAKGPLVTATLARRALGLRLPALLSDAAALPLLAEEISRSYAARKAGEALAADELQYADLAEWQNELLDSEDAAEGRRHWRQLGFARHLALRLPLEKDGAAPFAPRHLTRRLDGGTLDRLRGRAEALGVPLERLLLGAWLVLLRRLTDAEEIVVGTSFDGRRYEELERAQGPFARLLPVLCRVGAGDRLAQMLTRLGSAIDACDEWIESFTWDDQEAAAPAYPFGWEMQPPPPSFDAAGLRFVVEDFHHCLERCTAHVVCREVAEGLLVRLCYDAERLGEDDAERLARCYLTLLGSLAAETVTGATPVGSLRIFDEPERRRLLAELNPPAAEISPERCVHELFEEQAARTPQRPALVDGSQELSYGELRRRAHRLAHRLRRLGVAPEVRVAICLERSADVVVAMLAVLEAGGAYVPLDPAYPRERLAFLLDDARASVLVSSKDLAETRWDGEAPAAPRHVTWIDDDGEPEGEDAGAPPPRATADHLAYMIYTSGSTGRPKGTAIGHRQLTNYVLAAVEALALPDEGHFALVSTFAADLGTTMTFPALCRGGTLHVVDERRVTDPEAWAEYTSRRPIDCLKIVPSHLKMLREGAQGPAGLPRRRLILGGEACDWELVDHVASLVPDCRIFNHYGPTESTVGVLTQPLSPTGTDRPPAPALGRPLANNRIYLLDACLEPVPAGVAGELYVSGPQLARGYLGRPGQTAERFLPDPWGGEAGARMYRTGDRVLFQPGGGLAFQGRADDQVKIHGFRIEPQEVASVLRELPEVAEALVLPHHDPPDRHRLVAYVVPAGSAGLRPAELRRKLTERLPEHMVPAAFVGLDAFPLTPNGKVDRKALPSPDEAAPAREGRPAAPRNSVEVQLLQLWEDVLDVGPIGACDNFFEIGGNSFLAVRLMARLRNHFGHSLPFATLLSAGNVRELAAVLQGQDEAKPPEHLVAIQPRGSRPPLFCAHPGHGSVICYLELAHHLGPDQPVYGFQALDFDLDRDPHKSLPEMCSRYVDELLRRRDEGPRLLAGWSFGGLVAFEMAQQLHERGREVDLLVLFDCRLPVTAPMLTGLDPSLLQATMLFDHVTDRGEEGGITPQDLVGLGLDEQLALISEKLGVRPEELVPEEFGPELAHRYVEMRMARIDALREYVLRPYAGKILLLRATEETPDVPLEEMRKSFAAAARTPDYGWGEISSRPVEVLDVPGTHGSMLAEPHVREVARRLNAALADNV